MSRYFVRYNGQPIKFSTPGGKFVADVVIRTMATSFEGPDKAYARCLEQWTFEAVRARCTFDRVDGGATTKEPTLL